MLHVGSDHRILHRDVQADGREHDQDRSEDLLEALANLLGEEQQ